MAKFISFEARVRRYVSIDEQSGCWVWNGVRDGTGYGAICYQARRRAAHRVAYEIYVGPIPEGSLVDHVCLNRACVNPAHLRLATHKQNMEHPDGLRKTNHSGYRGVSWDAFSGRWRAVVTHNRKSYVLGRFDSAAEAGEAARLKRIELFTHNDADRAIETVS